jgi:hypothetical protein
VRVRVRMRHLNSNTDIHIREKRPLRATVLNPANLLNDEQKLFRVHGDGAGPVANLTGRARQYRRPDYTATGEAGCGMYGTRRGRGMF